MYPAPFTYVRAESLEEALELLAAHGDEARPLAGGQSLLPLMKQRDRTPAVVVDIGRLAELAYVEWDEEGLRIGALTRHVDLASADLPPGLALLRDAGGVIGDVQVRNAGTVGGALAHADPAGDWAPALQALDAVVQVRSKTRERSLTVSELLVAPFTTALAADELVTEIRVPMPPTGTNGAYVKLGRRVGDFALASVAVNLTLDEHGVCVGAGIGVGGAAPTAVKHAEAEACLRGSSLETEAVDEAAAAAGSIPLLDDARATAEYRRAMVPVLLKRAVHAAQMRRAGEDVRAGYV